MTTDEEKSKIDKLMQGVEVQEVKLSERSSGLVREFHKRFGNELEAEMQQEQVQEEYIENPFRVDPNLLVEVERKLGELLVESKRPKRSTVLSGQDPKRPWRTNSNKEKLLRIDSELKQHLEKSTQSIMPLPEDAIKNLVKECQHETNIAPPVGYNRLRDTVEAAKKSLPNFQYKKIDNSTAVSILSEAHELEPKFGNLNDLPKACE